LSDILLADIGYNLQKVCLINH